MDSLLRLVVATTLLTLTANASAIQLSTVGSLDTLAADTNAGDVYTNPDSLGNYSEQDEEDWVEAILGYDVDYTKYDFAGTWLDVDDGDSTTDYWAIDFFAEPEDGAGLATGPDFFLLKTGSGATSDGIFLFENNASVQYGFIDLNVLGVNNVGNVSVISHFGAMGSSVKVPEPGTIALMVVGLAGLLVARRRKTSMQ